jgi:hypothetical protein
MLGVFKGHLMASASYSFWGHTLVENSFIRQEPPGEFRVRKGSTIPPMLKLTICYIIREISAEEVAKVATIRDGLRRQRMGLQTLAKRQSLVLSAS